MAKAQGEASGFTIIEVTIVLAIAGIIIMLVLQAIPALQRSGRNDRRKQDVAAILEAVSHWELTNSGNFPNFPANPADNYLQYIKLYFYDVPHVVSHPRLPGAGAIAPNIITDTVDVYNRAVCDPSSPGGANDTGSGYNDVVALYTVETSGGLSSKCQQL